MYKKENKKMIREAQVRQEQTRRERIESALYLRLKKRKRLFLKKKLEVFFFQKTSHSTEKGKRGDPLGLINIYSLAKYQKTRKGDSF